MSALRPVTIRLRPARLLLVVALLAVACLPAQAAGRGRAAEPMTGRVFDRRELRAQLPGVILGDNHYAEVNSAWLRRWYPQFRSKLSKLGLARWNERFDCNRIADFYTDLAQATFAVEMFHSNTPAQALALGPFWYERANGRGRHAIIQALTERGRIFIDPQNGEEIQLTPSERASGYVQLL